MNFKVVPILTVSTIAASLLCHGSQAQEFTAKTALNEFVPAAMMRATSRLSMPENPQFLIRV